MDTDNKLWEKPGDSPGWGTGIGCNNEGRQADRSVAAFSFNSNCGIQDNNPKASIDETPCIHLTNGGNGTTTRSKP
jgi:hypothetical protein